MINKTAEAILPILAIADTLFAELTFVVSFTVLGNPTN